MKSKLLFLASLFIATSLLAQPTINLGGMPELGTVIVSSSVNGAGISPGAAGANQTWNFTAYPDTGAIDSFTFVNPATTPFASTFPSATTAYENNNDTNAVYGYIKETSTALELVGAAFFDGSTNFISQYTNPQTIYGFPGTFNSALNDTYRRTSDLPSFEATFVSNGTISYVIDGYGTLITSGGTYPNTLRIKKRDISSDSTITDFGAFVSESRNTTYEWVTVAPGATLGIWSISTDTTLGTFGQPDSYSQNVTHTRGNFANVGVSKVSLNTLSMFPNPANDNVLLMLPQDAHVSIIDIGGREIQSFYFSLADGNLPLLNVASLQAGTYLIAAKGKNYSSIGKLLVVH